MTGRVGPKSAKVTAEPLCGCTDRHGKDLPSPGRLQQGSPGLGCLPGREGKGREGKGALFIPSPPGGKALFPTTTSNSLLPRSRSEHFGQQPSHLRAGTAIADEGQAHPHLRGQPWVATCFSRGEKRGFALGERFVSLPRSASAQRQPRNASAWKGSVGRTRRNRAQNPSAFLAEGGWLGSFSLRAGAGWE